MLRIPVVVSPTKSLLELLNTFQTGRSHLALVSHSPGITLESLKHGVRLEGAARPVGIITLEDIIEEIIQEASRNCYRYYLLVLYLKVLHLVVWWRDLTKHRRKSKGIRRATQKEADRRTTQDLLNTLPSITSRRMSRNKGCSTESDANTRPNQHLYCSRSTPVAQ
ncbi:unnamed protein product [Ascophyllum nodosum]